MEDVKTRHLRRDPRASLVVAESETLLRGVEPRTEASLVDRDVRATAVRIATRYVGEAKATEYVGSAEKDVIARLEPGHLRVWDSPISTTDPQLTCGGMSIAPGARV